MTLFVVREYQDFPAGKVLVSLSTLVERIGFDIPFWSLRKITLTCNADFFGVAVNDLQELSRRLSDGFVLSNKDFQSFLKTDFQIVDGYIDGYGPGSQAPLFQIECVDAAQWEISTNSADIALQLKDRLRPK
jgi:hypothetical protein